jgi:hypothetical protein
MENENNTNPNIQSDTKTDIPLPPKSNSINHKKRKTVIVVIFFVIVCALAIWTFYTMRNTAPAVAPVTIEQKIESIQEVHKMNEDNKLPSEQEIIDIIKYNSQN